VGCITHSDYLLDYTEIYDHYLSLLKKERGVIERLLSEQIIEDL